MSTPRVAEAKRGVMCAGYGHHAHLVDEQVYRIDGCTTHLCWECLLLWLSEQKSAVPTHRRMRFLRRRFSR